VHFCAGRGVEVGFVSTGAGVVVAPSRKCHAAGGGRKARCDEVPGCCGSCWLVLAQRLSEEGPQHDRLGGSGGEEMAEIVEGLRIP
jgi:hypothetical protein